MTRSILYRGGQWNPSRKLDGSELTSAESCRRDSRINSVTMQIFPSGVGPVI